jgi:hypothetical protein
MKYTTADFHFRGAFYFFALPTGGRMIIPDLAYVYTKARRVENRPNP